MDLGLTDRVAVVTGGSSGIGLAIVELLVDEGMKVVVVDRDPCPAEGPRVHCVRGDLADPETCRRAVADAVMEFGSLDVLVNNAGRNDSVGLDAGPEAFAASLQQNLVHVYTMAHLARPHLALTTGSIVNVGSKVAVTGQALEGPRVATLGHGSRRRRQHRGGVTPSSRPSYRGL
jgi:L-fucose dehydrogenase